LASLSRPGVAERLAEHCACELLRASLDVLLHRGDDRRAVQQCIARFERLSAMCDVDGVTQWWLTVAQCALHWLVDDLVTPLGLYARVRAVNKSLLADHAVMSMGHAFCARKLSLEPSAGDHRQLVVAHVAKAFEHSKLIACRQPDVMVGEPAKTCATY